MNKTRVLVAVIGVLILAEGFGIVYFASSANKFQRILRNDQERVAKIKKPAPAAVPNCPKGDVDRQCRETMEKYDDLLKELEAVKADRANILTQTKTLLGERGKSAELQDELARVKSSVGTIEKSKQELEVKNKVLQSKIGELHEARARIALELEEMKLAYERVQNNTAVKDLNAQITELQKSLKIEKADAKEESKKNETAVNTIKKELAKVAGQRDKLAVANEQLKTQAGESQQQYADAAEKNKALEQKIREMPGKFVEVSRQNQVLLKQTAEMHYNLGVFYTKHKEYDRALSEFVKGVEINPNDAYAHFNIGYIYAEYRVNRKKAMEHFRRFLSLAKGGDPDVDWAKKYLLTWETYEGKDPM
ncbi:MAG: hypothetical protein HZA28_01070 [Candidatus Omnitrophica bacterium]|nr:hypothetical protein [Candidatus Omnitrophota bacterium]